jgi:NAD(P)-dependent dehydrogenase (short-subunit alcohol dehydrogenase family)
VLIFGVTGVIGESIASAFIDQGYSVVGVARSKKDTLIKPTNSFSWVVWNLELIEFTNELTKNLGGKKIDSVVWAQGINFNDTVEDFDSSKHLEMYDANVVFIIKTLKVLLNNNFLDNEARLCVISSIWQNLARQSKLSYCITKSALQGLVQALSIDLGVRGTLINAILPGALDTPMTRANLKPEQIQKIESATPLGALPKLEDVTSLAFYLCSPNNTGITGQFIAVDRGFSHARII